MAAHQRHPHDHDVEAEVARVVELLRAGGGRITPGRRAVVTALFTGDDHHSTAEGLARRVQAEHPDVHLSTVYRALEQLEALGVVGRVAIGDGPAVYHLTDHVHHHLVCEGCGTVLEVDHRAVGPLADRLEAEHGFALSGRHLTLTGRCRRCREGATGS